MGLDAESLEFRGKPFAHFVDLWTIRGICWDRRDCDCCRKAINEWFLERINTTINTKYSRGYTCRKRSSDKPLSLWLRRNGVEESEFHSNGRRTDCRSSLFEFRPTSSRDKSLWAKTEQNSPTSFGTPETPLRDETIAQTWGTKTHCMYSRCCWNIFKDVNVSIGYFVDISR